MFIGGLIKCLRESPTKRKKCLRESINLLISLKTQNPSLLPPHPSRNPDPDLFQLDMDRFRSESVGLQVGDGVFSRFSGPCPFFSVFNLQD